MEEKVFTQKRKTSTVDMALLEKEKPRKAPEDDPLFKKYAKKKSQRFTHIKPDANGRRSATTGLSLAPYTGPWTEIEAAHLLKRTHFGAKVADINTIKALSVSVAVEKMLTFPAKPSLPTPTPVNFYNSILADTNGIALNADYTKDNFTNYDNSTLEFYRTIGIMRWQWGVYLSDAVHAREKLTDFWHHFIPINHSAVGGNATNGHSMIYDYREILRNNCLGNFKTLIKAIAKSQAMLIYLGGQESTPETPNENFARELFELFTVGKENNQANQKYTEVDIQSAAKIFSGWRMEDYILPYAQREVAFNPDYHNQEAKVFSSNFANTTIANQAGADGANEFDLFFNMLFANQGLTIAKYISRKIYRYFVYYEIDAPTEAAVITPMANLFVSGNWEIKPVITLLFKSEHFFDASNRGVMIKSPIDYIVGMNRTFLVNTTTNLGPVVVENQYYIYEYHQYTSMGMEQGIGEVPNVSGWKAYYQSPTYYQNWITSSTIQARELYINYLFYGIDIYGVVMVIDPILYVQQFPQAIILVPDTLINAIIAHLLPFDLNATYKADILKKDNLLNFQENPDYWSNAWTRYLAMPTDQTRKDLVEQRLRALLTAILKLAEFQLM
jgi:uncharacterized protein (DUF1800 family)